MARQTRSQAIRKPASPPERNPIGCVEIVGGNESRTQALVVAGLELVLVARPAGARAGGDVYCLHSCENRAVAKIVLLDITGHGHHSASVARAIHDLLHQYSADTRPSRLLDLMNRQFPQFAPPGILATSLCAVYDSRRGQLHYSNGGQPRCLFWSAGRKQWSSLGRGWESACGVPFGVTEGACYEEESVSLQPSDILFMFSDGVEETQSPTGGLLQSEGVLALADECMREMGPGFFVLPALASAFLRRLEAFHGGRKFRDDLTLVWARRPSEERHAISAGT
jgi:serine phosphatase RsbU (regulator of sigma subunit)